ncbi:hypothetical protein P0Y08_003829 [Escherichia coli]|uniref:hypothetical protein n=1 Tax=Escherichia coli TaxID=562 RepID=UPI0010DB23E4|nr:hypothetical protein [Escherichia coli]EKK3462908.1 hypothetical protein [Escherichia coli O145]EKY2436318.1 hypothetical protein [Escherichia coli O104]EEQ4232242.1 hypothetical protein [Escherichia coli]EEU5830589.1 hypothetical protein [Escherichia coli]EEV0564982.1 hypothetical protein [Escherichia coli]
MREKIKNPVVVLYKRETSDSYAVSITDGSQNMHDGLLMASVSPDEADNSFAVFAMVGYYMAAEIEKLRAQRDALAAENVALRSKAAELAHEASKIYSAYNATITEPDGDFMDMQTLHEMQCIETPATDAFLAEIERKAIRKFINSIEHILRDKLSPYDTEEMLEAMRIFLEEQGGEQK